MDAMSAKVKDRRAEIWHLAYLNRTSDFPPLDDFVNPARVAEPVDPNEGLASLAALQRALNKQCE